MTPPPLLNEVTWETRNLGVASYALSASELVEQGAPALSQALSDKAREHADVFVQAKLDQKFASSSNVLSALGFYFVELALQPYLNFKDSALLDEFSHNPAAYLRGRFQPGDLPFSLLDKQDASHVHAVRDIAGDSFTTDRFHLDPNCPDETANKRYQLWVDQMLSDNDCLFYVVMHDGQVVGFMTQRGETLPLAGFARSHTRSGLGDYLWLSTLLKMREQGLTRVSTGISTNNVGVLNLYARLGFRFRNPTAVYHYWSAERLKGPK